MRGISLICVYNLPTRRPPSLMTTVPPPPTSESDLPVAHDFARAMQHVWMRDGIVATDACDIAAAVATSFAAGGAGARSASQLLQSTGIRPRWNAILRDERAAVLAGRIRPLVHGRLLDVLSGDGSICRALTALDLTDLAATERRGHYPDSHLPTGVDFHAFEEDADLSHARASTALLSTVLHHERDPLRLLDALASTPIRRWIVIENCVTPEFSPAFHRFADQFFNHCLNEFGSDCVEQHRTLDEWSAVLTRYGAVSIVDAAFTVPGIPFPYSLMVVNRGEMGAAAVAKATSS